MGKEISVQIERNEASKKIDPNFCFIKDLISGELKTVNHSEYQEMFEDKSSFYLEKKGAHKSFCVVKMLLSFPLVY